MVVGHEPFGWTITGKDRAAVEVDHDPAGIEAGCHVGPLAGFNGRHVGQRDRRRAGNDELRTIAEDAFPGSRFVLELEFGAPVAQGQEEVDLLDRGPFSFALVEQGLVRLRRFLRSDPGGDGQLPIAFEVGQFRDEDLVERRSQQGPLLGQRLPDHVTGCCRGPASEMVVDDVLEIEPESWGVFRSGCFLRVHGAVAEGDEGRKERWNKECFGNRHGWGLCDRGVAWNVVRAVLTEPSRS